MTSNDLSVTFWGVRGSIPCPGPATVRYGGNTPCLEVRAAGRLMIFDAGTGLLPLGNALAARGAAIDADWYFTHTHFDHIQGIPFFSPLYDKRYRDAPYDLREANRLLDELGLKRRDGEWVRRLPDGRPLAITVETAGEDIEQLDVLQLIKDTWREAGVGLWIFVNARPPQARGYLRDTPLLAHAMRIDKASARRLNPRTSVPFYLFVDVSEALSPDGLRTTTEFAEALLRESRVALTQGEAFDAPGFLRISYANSMENLREGSRRLLEFVSAHAPKTAAAAR